MRDLILIVTMTALIPLSLTRPFIGVLLFSWISFMNPHQLNWGMSSSIQWAMIIAVTTIIGSMIKGELKHLVANAVTVPIALFLVCITITSTVALAPPELVWAKWEATFKAFAFLLVAAAVVRSKVRIHALLWIMVISLGYFGIRGGVFVLMTAGNYRVWGPPNTMISDNNQIAVALLVALPLMNYLRLQAAHRIVRVVLMAAMTLTLISVLGSYSRGALVGVAAVAGFLWWNGKSKVVSGVVMVAVLFGALSFMPASWTDRMSTIKDYQSDESTEGRFDMWRTSTIMAVSRPLTGGGFMGPYRQDLVTQYNPGTKARAVHSIYFEVIGEHGFPTFLIWLSITLGGIGCTIRILRATRKLPELGWCRDLAKMTQVAIIAYLVPGALLSLSYWDYYYTIIIVIAATDQYVQAAVRDRDDLVAPSSTWRRRGLASVRPPTLIPHLSRES